MTQCPHEGNLGSSWYPTRKWPKFTPCFLVFFWLAICGNILRLFAVWPNPGTIVLTLSSYHPHVSAENSWWLLTNLYYNPWKLEETKNCHNRKIIEHNLQTSLQIIHWSGVQGNFPEDSWSSKLFGGLMRRTCTRKPCNSPASQGRSGSAPQHAGLFGTAWGSKKKGKESAT